MPSGAAKSARVRVGVDSGGTFTDFVFAAHGKLHVFKLPSTPADPSLAIRKGLERIADLTATDLTRLDVVHGTTVGTNALLQRGGARVALVTTKGFEDVLVIGRQARPELYNLNAVNPPPLVADGLRIGVAERVTCSGEVIQPLSDSELSRLVTMLKKSRVEAVGVSLLFSFLHPEHEERIARRLEELGVPLSISHRILPEYREFERTSTVAINAYLQPLMGTYLNRLAQPPQAARKTSRNQNTKNEGPQFSLRVMQSSGGSISAQVAASEPVRTILSGPSGGVVGALRAARAAGFANIITFDMGGTSTDVALCDSGGIRTTNEASIAGLPVAVSVMDIHTVGAGGGSIARVDSGGSLRVGPESAGADPGPACYGRSFLPTVTDAHLLLGHFAGAGLLGGEFVLDQSRSEQALAELALNMSRAAKRTIRITEAAQGIVSVAATNMERALRHISVERGRDPRGFALLPFGGAGGLHAVELARALRISRVLVPAAPGALSAIGVVVADVIRDQSRTVMLEVGDAKEVALEQAFKEMESAARSALLSEGFPEARQRHERLLAVRYKGQSFELEIKSTKGNIAASFHRAHQTRYGYAQQGSPVEIVSARLRSIGVMYRIPERRMRVTRKRVVAPSRYAKANLGGKEVRVAIYRREDLGAGMRLRVPCIMTEYSATTLVPEGASAEVDGSLNLIIQVSD
ncbi:MAG TPA: hydantoinase/oxoprolinase family protein [Pyrinomonadaceae bacterium]|nr:hydantoinase/oxoprolinase family protein [Pyrinomonadaceae bacterium]